MLNPLDFSVGFLMINNYSSFPSLLPSFFPSQGWHHPFILLSSRSRCVHSWMHTPTGVMYNLGGGVHFHRCWPYTLMGDKPKYIIYPADGLCFFIVCGWQGEKGQWFNTESGWLRIGKFWVEVANGERMKKTKKANTGSFICSVPLLIHSGIYSLHSFNICWPLTRHSW